MNLRDEINLLIKYYDKNYNKKEIKYNRIKTRKEIEELTDVVVIDLLDCIMSILEHDNLIDDIILIEKHKSFKRITNAIESYIDGGVYNLLHEKIEREIKDDSVALFINYDSANVFIDVYKLIETLNLKNNNLMILLRGEQKDEK